MLAVFGESKNTQPPLFIAKHRQLKDQALND
jgi:hypothetical protein